MTRPPVARLGLVWVGWLLTAFSAQADDTLATAYEAVLRGDYASGQAMVEKLRQQGAPADQITRLDGWLSSFHNASSDRDSIRRQTFDWNMQNARAALERGRAYLALSFAAQASFYADDEQAFAADEWVQQLRTRALVEADGYAKQEKWSKAHAYYVLLERINAKDKESRELRERTARYVRLEVLYKKPEDLERRLKGVNFGLLQQVVANIDQHYFERPDFRVMAEGALDNLAALCHTTKLYDTDKAFDGIANPAAREHFLGQLEKLRQEMAGAERFDAKRFLALFKSVRDLNRTSVSLPEELLVVEFTEGALDRLDDYTTVIWPADALDFDKMMVGNFFGVGIQLGLDEATNRLKVVTPLENSPALRAGIQPGDLILAVDGESTKDWTSDQAVRRITGPEEGTEVKLVIFRPSTGKQTEHVLKRGQIKLTTVRGVNRIPGTSDRWNYIIDPDAGIGYVRLTGFNPDSASELEKSLTEARAQGMKALVLDLRYNPGGLLDVAVDVTSLFQPKGQVVSTKARNPLESDELDVDGDADFSDLPLVVLVNDGSASAAEILAGALQSHNRAVVLGERTFGKGSVQKVMGLGSPMREAAVQRARLKLTTALYYLPNGKSPHRKPDAEQWGVDPDWSIKLTPKEIEKNLEREREAFVIHNEESAAEELDESARQKELDSIRVDTAKDDEDEEDNRDLLTPEEIKELRNSPHKVASADPQLDTALLQLRVKLAANLPWPRQVAQRPVDAAPKQP